MVEPQYRTFGRRVGALFLDRLPFFGLEQARDLLSSAFGSLYFGLAWGELLGWVWIAYRVLTHGVWGQTLGKKICKVRVVDLSGQRLSMKQAVLREIVPIVLSLASVFYLVLDREAYLSWAAGRELSSRLATGGTVYTLAVGIWWLAQLISVVVNEQRRAIHDFIAGSVVLRLDVQETRPEAQTDGGPGGTTGPETRTERRESSGAHWLARAPTGQDGGEQPASRMGNCGTRYCRGGPGADKLFSCRLSRLLSRGIAPLEGAAGPNFGSSEPGSDGTGLVA